jgi:hypothetical protein
MAELFDDVDDLDLPEDEPEATDTDNEDGEDSSTDEPGQKEEKLIPASQVNKIVQDRLSRQEKKMLEKYKDHDKLQQLSSYLDKYGYTGSLDDKLNAIKAQAEELEKTNELEKLQEEADKYGMSPELLKMIKDTQKEILDLKKDKQESLKALEQQKAVNTQIQAFDSKYAEKGISVEKLRQNPKFVKFNQVADPKLTLTQVYEQYIAIFGDAEAEAIAKIKLNLDRSTASGKERGGSDNTHGLSKDEIDLVDEYNQMNPKSKMSYSEFAKRKRR